MREINKFHAQSRFEAPRRGRLPAHVGRSRVYLLFYAKIYRTKCPTFNMGGAEPVKRTYQKEFLATVGPYFAKDRLEFNKFLRQVATANMGMGVYDWEFEVISHGAVSVKTREDIGRNNQQAPEGGQISREIFRPNGSA